MLPISLQVNICAFITLVPNINVRNVDYYRLIALFSYNHDTIQETGMPTVNGNLNV